MPRLIIACVSLLSFCLVHGQPAYSWSAVISGDSPVRISDIHTAIDGALYLTGQYKGEVSIELGLEATSISTDGNGDYVLILKLNRDGTYAWHKILESAFASTGLEVTTDQDDNMIVCGYFSGSLNIDPGASETTLTNSDLSSGDDAFLISYTSEGGFNWGRSIGGQFSDLAQHLVTDEENNIYVLGKFQVQADFDPTSGIDLITAVQGFDVFLQKYNVIGNVLWTRTFGSSSNNSHTALALNSANEPFLGLVYQDSIDVNPGLENFVITNDEGTDLGTAIIHLSSNGEYIGVFEPPGIGVKHFSVMDEQSFIIQGETLGTHDLDPGPDEFIVTSEGDFDEVVCRYDNSELSWVNGIFSYNDKSVQTMSTDSSGAVLICGTYKDSIDFDLGEDEVVLSSMLLASDSPGPDNYFVQYSNQGALDWILTFPSQSVDQSYGISINDSGTLHLAGTFNSPIFPDYTQGTLELNWDESVNDIFIICGGDSLSIGVQDNFALNLPSVYPNPTYGIVHIDGPQYDSVTLLDNRGQKVGVYGHVKELSLPDTKGVYYLLFHSTYGRFVQRIVKL